jgi:hypothetical protein
LPSEPLVLDIDSTIKPLHGHQEGAMVGYNPPEIAAACDRAAIALELAGFIWAIARRAQSATL